MRPMLTALALTVCASSSLLFFVLAARAQSLSASQEIVGVPAYTPRGHVRFTDDAADVSAGKPAVVELRFHVDDGFHINSHQPSSELLIPTTLHLDPSDGVNVVSTEYPKGSPFHLALGEGEMLDVYQGEFRVKVTIVAAKGHSTLRGNLHYQACDKAACFPPRNLSVALPIVAK